jgi:hypothetical protein
MIPPVYDESEIPERLRRLLALEIARILDDLESRRTFLLEVWSRHRDRGPLLDTVFSRWRTLSMTDLALIDSDAIVACDAFYRDLEELRLYFQFTQDMPTTLDVQYENAVEHIAASGALAVQLLGGAPERPLVEFAEEPGEPRLSLLVPVAEPDGEE